MANKLNVTPWKMIPGDGTSKTFAIPATTAGSKIIVTAVGGAIVTVRITDSSGTLFDKRTTYGGGEHDTSIQDYDDAVGGVTQVYISLNGASYTAGHIYEIADLGAYVAGSAQNNGGGLDIALAGNFLVQCTSGDSQLTSGKGLLVGVFEARNSAVHTPPWKHLQLGPYGELDHQSFADSSADSGFMSSALMDVDASSSYPENLAAGHYKATTQDYTASKAFCCQALYADTSDVLTVPEAPSQIARENSLPGVNTAYWYIGNNPVNEGTIAGFTDKASYLPGETVHFSVDSSNNPYRIELYRLGHYGIEANASRNPLGYGTFIVNNAPVAQPTPLVDGTTGATSCTNWTQTDSWTIPADATPGLYEVLMRRQDVGNTGLFYVTHLIVKSSVATDKIAVILPDTTWQAYNSWGATTDHGDRSGIYTGRSLYELGADGASDAITRRAYAVSFDRPYNTQSIRQNTYWYDSEQPWIVFAEAQGYDLTYFSCIDLEVNPHLLDDAKAVVILGHHEYWSENIYDCFTNARDAGVNLLFHSSNTALWRIRFAAADTNHRTVICYKDSATIDIGPGFTGTGRDPLGYTGTWRDSRTAVAPNNPDVRRENALTGQLFWFNAGVGQPVKVQFDKKALPMWRNNAGVQALPSPIASYSFDEGSGSVLTDTSGNGHDLPLPATGPPNWDIAGHTNGGISDNGTSGTGDPCGVDRTDWSTWLPVGGAISSMCWAKLHTDTAAIIISMGVDSGYSGNFCLYYLTDVHMGIYMSVAGVTYTVQYTWIPDDVWHHWAATCDGVTLKLYLDGVVVGSTPVPGFPEFADTGNLMLGLAYPTFNGIGMDGILDDVRIYDVALTDAEVNTLMTRDVASGGGVGEWTTPLGIGMAPVGDEGDVPDGSAGEPSNMVKLTAESFDSSTAGNLASNANGTIYSNPFTTKTMSFTLYRADSGALVFNTGAWRGSRGISRYWGAFQSDVPDVDWQNSWLAIMYDLGFIPHTLQAMQYVDAPVIDPSVGAPGPTRNDIALAYGLTVPSGGDASIDSTVVASLTIAASVLRGAAASATVRAGFVPSGNALRREAVTASVLASLVPAGSSSSSISGAVSGTVKSGFVISGLRKTAGAIVAQVKARLLAQTTSSKTVKVWDGTDWVVATRHVRQDGEWL